MSLQNCLTVAGLLTACSVPTLARAQATLDSIFDQVTGTWRWIDDACDQHAHTLSFSDDRAQMRLVSHDRDSVTGRWKHQLTVYDVLHHNEVLIRGAIIGEGRRADDSSLVQWDLVLFAKDRYCWHRADWSAESCTRPNVRCPPQPKAPLPDPDPAEPSFPWANGDEPPAVAGVRIGDTRETLDSTLGVPFVTRELTPGVTEFEYPDRGIRIVQTDADGVAVIALQTRGAGGVGGFHVGDSYNQVRHEWGEPHQQDERVRLYVLGGWAIAFRLDDTDRQIVSVSVGRVAR